MTIKHRYGSGVGFIPDRAAGAAARNSLAHDFTPACTVSFAALAKRYISRLSVAIGPKQTWASALHMSAFGGKADTPDLMPRNRPPRSCRSTKQIGTRARSIR